MIEKQILDEVIPVPELEKLRDKRVTELAEEGFTITNFHSGGIFHTALMIALRIQIELLELARKILNQMFVTHASGTWLDLKVADYSKKRKAAQKTRGLVTITRGGSGDDAIKIAKGHIFKTAKDINGEELRFFTLEATVLQKGAVSVDVLVEAEVEGARYNVPPGQITRSQDVALTVTTSDALSYEEITGKVKAILTELLGVRKGRKLYELTLSDINHAVRSGYGAATNVTISTPAQDVTLDKDKVITLGEVIVMVRRG